MISPQRFLSLDVFRRFTMAAMVLVENPGTWPVYRQLYHAKWGGAANVHRLDHAVFLIRYGDFFSAVANQAESLGSQPAKTNPESHLALHASLVFALCVVLFW